MKQEKSVARLFSGKKAFSLALAVLLVLGCSVGATLAWLTATTNEVKNTFTVGNVEITLQEHKYVAATNSLDTTTTVTDKVVDGKRTAANSYKLIPGSDMPKDPFVTVKGGSEKCWLFVLVKEENNVLSVDSVTGAVDQVVNFSLNNNGGFSSLKFDSDEEMELADGCTVLFKVVDASSADQKFNVLAPYGHVDNTTHTAGCVRINEDVTQEWLDENEDTLPSLTFTAAAIQFDGFEYDEADETGDSQLNAVKCAFENLPDEFKNAALKPATTPET